MMVSYVANAFVKIVHLIIENVPLSSQTSLRESSHLSACQQIGNERAAGVPIPQLRVFAQARRSCRFELHWLKDAATGANHKHHSDNELQENVQIVKSLFALHRPTLQRSTRFQSSAVATARCIEERYQSEQSIMFHGTLRGTQRGQLSRSCATLCVFCAQDSLRRRIRGQTAPPRLVNARARTRASQPPVRRCTGTPAS